jgi:thiol-disulfide isomerase/thioredoxin
MLGELLGVALGCVLAGSAAFKARDLGASGRGLATFGVAGSRAQGALAIGLIAVEFGLGVAVAVGSDWAAWAAAGLMAAFAAGLAGALLRGRRGQPCGCFGARSRVGPWGLVRNLGLAAAFAVLPFVRDASPSIEGWLAIGLAVALAGVGVLGVLVLGLAREVGTLRLAIGPQAALELSHEGPELGSRTDLVRSFSPHDEARLLLALFTSEGCAACRTLEPTLEYVARDPVLAVERFDEHRDAEAWRALDVPGSPFAVAMGLDGTVLAKGTFNTLPQLEGLLGAAERRQREALNA